MEEKSIHVPHQVPTGKKSGRRSMLLRGGAMIGACLFASPAIPAIAGTTGAPDTTATTNTAATTNTTNTTGPAGGPAGAPGTDSIFDVKKFGATGKSSDNATGPFRDAIQACFTAGGGTVYVPPGEYTVGTITLKDNVTLNIEAGATLLLSQSKSDFVHGSEAMIFAENAKNIGVTGKGTLNGLAQYDYKEMTGIDRDIAAEIELAKAAGADMRRYYRKRSAMNTFMFVINDCVNFSLTGVSVINSPLWNIRLNDCDRVQVRGVYIFSDLEKGVNGDGIDLVSCTNVTISDSVIVTGDDCIVLKTIARKGRTANPCENIVVTNCILTSSSTALMIGTETEADIRHVLFNNCVIRNSNKGFGINVQDGATVSDIIFSNLTIDTNRRHWNWWGDAEMCKFLLIKRVPSSRLGIIKDIVIDNVIAHARGTSTIKGHDSQPLENIRMSNVQIFMNAENEKDKRATHGLLIRQVSDLQIRDMSVKWSKDPVEAKWQSALVLDKVKDFQIDGFAGRQGLDTGASPVILIRDGSDGIIRDSKALEGSHAFIRIEGDDSNDITLRNNDSKRAQKEIEFGKEEWKRAVKIDKL